MVASDSDGKKVVCSSLSSSDPNNKDGGGASFDKSPHEEIVAAIRELAQKGKWEDLMQRLRAEPAEASLQDERGRTALHHACAISEDGSFPPKNVVEFVLNACPAASWTPDDFGWTPLSLACSNNAPEDVIGLLLKVHEAPVSMQTHCGMTPLYLATWSRAPLSVLEMLLRVGPGLVLWPTIVEETPLTLLWSENKDSLLRGVNTDKNREEKQEPDPTSEEDWQRLELFLKAAFHESIAHPLPGDLKFRALHAACSIGCPLPLVKAVMARYREQIWERDEFGRLPLTLAASAPVYKPPSKRNNRGDGDNVDSGEEDEDDETEDEDDYGEEYGYARDEGDSIDLDEMEGDPTGDGDEDDNPENGSQDGQNVSGPGGSKAKIKRRGDESLIDILLRANPIAAKVPDQYGRLPLYLAIESRKTWDQGLRSLLDSTPEALAARDNVTHMYPFMLAAVENLQSLDVVFELLLAYPQALSTCVENSDTNTVGGKK